METMRRDDGRAVRFTRLVEARDAEGLRALFQEHPELHQVLNEPWFAFETPALVHASGMGDRALIDTLIDLGADLDARSDWDAGPYSALHRCVDGATPETLELAEHLIARGATLDLHTAAGLGRMDVLATFLDAEPERVNEPGPDGATPLHLAKDVETAAFLLDRGAKIDKRCVDHRSTPAMWSVQGREEVTRFLLDRGATPDLFMAAVLDDVALADRILADDPSAIHVSVRYGKSHEHLGFGDKYVWALGFADTPVEVARRRGNDAVYRYLLERSSTSVRLLQASRGGDLATMTALLDSDPNLLPGLSDDQICAIFGGALDAARLMLERGADPNVRDDDHGATALHHASWNGDRERITLLLEHGADPQVRDHRYFATPIGWANEAGHQHLVQMYATTCALDVVDAALLGKADRVRQILEADPSLVNGLGGGRASPLRSAAWFGRIEVVRLLLESGADPLMAHPESGKTALDFAKERGHEEIASILASAGGP